MLGVTQHFLTTEILALGLVGVVPVLLLAHLVAVPDDPASTAPSQEILVRGLLPTIDRTVSAMSMSLQIPQIGKILWKCSGHSYENFNI